MKSEISFVASLGKSSLKHKPSSFNTMFNVKFTFWLALVLFIPFILREKWGHNGEIFPAVMLPTGAIKVPVGAAERSIKEITLYAQKNSGEWGRVDLRALLAPIPAQYHKTILLREFGLNKIHLNKKPRTSGFMEKLKSKLKPRDATDIDIASTKAWLKDKLIKQHFQSATIKVVHTTIRGYSNQIKQTAYESIILLD